jgi:hypothetical protein
MSLIGPTFQIIFFKKLICPTRAEKCLSVRLMGMSQGSFDSFSERQLENWDRGTYAISDGYVSPRDWRDVTLSFTR